MFTVPLTCHLYPLSFPLTCPALSIHTPTRLLPTILRFDAVYTSLFRCTSKRIADYPNLTQWTREMYQLPDVRATLDLPGLIRSYYVQLFPLNPSGIYPVGPTEEDLRLMEPHDRGQRFPVESIFMYK